MPPAGARGTAPGFLKRRRFIAALPAAILTGAARADHFPILDVAAVPETARAAYRDFLIMNVPRAFALGPGGRAGAAGDALNATAAIQQAFAQAGPSARLYAQDLAIAGQRPPPSPPPPLIETWNYSFVPDPRFLWRGPQAARGAYLWAHGTSTDPLGLQPPPHVRVFNNAGYDIVRFDRVPNADDVDRAALWLRAGIARVRDMGWRAVIAGGHSRGAWNCLQMLKFANLADMVVADSPAAHGIASGFFMSSQTDDLRQIVNDVPQTRTKLAFIQFSADEFIGDADTRTRLIERLRPRLGGLLLIDRPPEFASHFAARDLRFAKIFGKSLLALAT